MTFMFFPSSNRPQMYFARSLVFHFSWINIHFWDGSFRTGISDTFSTNPTFNSQKMPKIYCLVIPAFTLGIHITCALVDVFIQSVRYFVVCLAGWRDNLYYGHTFIFVSFEHKGEPSKEIMYPWHPVHSKNVRHIYYCALIGHTVLSPVLVRIYTLVGGGYCWVETRYTVAGSLYRFTSSLFFRYRRNGQRWSGPQTPHSSTNE